MWQSPAGRRIDCAVAFAVAVAACAAFAAPAGAATWVLKGAGYGHGIGMSQWGAEGLARHDKNYREIIERYYTGVQLGTASTKSIRVLLQANASTAKFKGATRIDGVALSARSRYGVRQVSNGLRLYSAHGRLLARLGSSASVSGPGVLTLYGTALNGRRNGHYRGSFNLARGAYAGVTVVNALALDQYVQGVIPGEVPSSWHMAALEAQAVAARSYALATDAGGSLFDQFPDTRSQMYVGVSGETARTNKAVRATAGEIATYRGKVATTYFFSTSGGRTESIQNVWYGAKAVPYLRSVRDPYDNISPQHRWRVKMSSRTLCRRLGSYCKGAVRSIKVLKHGVSPRIVRARVIGTRGSTTISGTTIRSRLGLRDTWVRFVRVRR